MVFTRVLMFPETESGKTSGPEGTALLYPGRDTFEFDQGHVIKNQPITVLVLLSESLGM